MVRSIENWREVIKEKESSRDIAKHIIGDLVGYRSSSVHESDDIEQLRNALIAYGQELTEPVEVE